MVWPAHRFPLNDIFFILFLYFDSPRGHWFPLFTSYSILFYCSNISYLSSMSLHSTPRHSKTWRCFVFVQKLQRTAARTADRISHRRRYVKASADSVPSNYNTHISVSFCTCKLYPACCLMNEECRVLSER